jgi:hypothetical protein
MSSRIYRLLGIVVVVLLAHGALVFILTRIRTSPAVGPRVATPVSVLPASAVKYADTKLRTGESPAPPDLPALTAPPVGVSPQFFPMFSTMEAGPGPRTRPEKGQPAFLAMARQNPPGFETVAGPGKGILKGHEGLANHLRQVTNMGLDVVFVFDSTESMAGVISEAKTKIKLMMRVLAELVPGFRVGMVAYRDYAAEYMTKPLPLTKDFQEVYGYIEATRVGMGYKTVDEVGKQDIEWSEAVYSGLEQAIGFRWRPTAKKIVILIGDAPPHPEELDQTLALVRSFWRTGGGQVYAIFIPPAIHSAKSGADYFDPKVQKLFTPKELDWLLKHDMRKRPNPQDETGRRIEEIFRNIAMNGGGDCVQLSDEREIVREMLNSALGRQWRGDINEIYDVLKETVAQ